MCGGQLPSETRAAIGNMDLTLEHEACGQRCPWYPDDRGASRGMREGQSSPWGEALPRAHTLQGFAPDVCHPGDALQSAQRQLSHQHEQEPQRTREGRTCPRHFSGWRCLSTHSVLTGAPGGRSPSDRPGAGVD